MRGGERVQTLETGRLVIRRFTKEDAPFALRLVNEPSFLANIGDKGVRTLEDAVRYLETGPIRMYSEHGHGMGLVTFRDTGAPIGFCGLIARDYLDAPDLGYAFVPEAWRQGFAFEAASAVLAWGRDVRGLSRVLAIVSPGNAPSIGLLGKLGFSYVKRMPVPPDGGEVALYETRPAGTP